MLIDIYCTNCKVTKQMEVKEVLPEDTAVDPVAYIAKYGTKEKPLSPIFAPSLGPIMVAKSHCPTCKSFQFRLVSIFEPTKKDLEAEWERGSRWVIEGEMDGPWSDKDREMSSRAWKKVLDRHTNRGVI